MKIEQESGTVTDKEELIILGTSIDTSIKAKSVLEMLNNIEEIEDVSIDMEDWEHVLRIDCGKPISTRMVMERIQGLGIFCYELADN